MLVSQSVKYTGSKINGYKVAQYVMDVKHTAATISFGRYWVEDGVETYVDDVPMDLTLEETIERMTAVIDGKSLADELDPWALAKGKERGLIPADAVLL